MLSDLLLKSKDAIIKLIKGEFGNRFIIFRDDNTKSIVVANKKNLNKFVFIEFIFSRFNYTIQFDNKFYDLIIQQGNVILIKEKEFLIKLDSKLS